MKRQPVDAWLTWWGCSLGGLGICGFAMIALQRYAASQLEFLLGATFCVLDGWLLLRLGALGREVHLTVRRGKAPWRAAENCSLMRWDSPSWGLASGRF